MRASSSAVPSREKSVPIVVHTSDMFAEDYFLGSHKSFSKPHIKRSCHKYAMVTIYDPSQMKQDVALTVFPRYTLRPTPYDRQINTVNPYPNLSYTHHHSSYRS